MLLIILSPVPHKAPDQQQIDIGNSRVKVVDASSLPPTIASPVNPAKEYFEFNILYANSIEFGVKTADMTMVSMHTVDTPGKVQLMLSLKRKELDIQFPLTIRDENSNKKSRKFRFRLPISLLSHVYKVQNKNPNEISLIIPFNSPPQFFMQRNEDELMDNGVVHTSFSDRERSWNDWGTWYRETDIIDDATRKQAKNEPLMSHKDKAIIDIGMGSLEAWFEYL